MPEIELLEQYHTFFSRYQYKKKKDENLDLQGHYFSPSQYKYLVCSTARYLRHRRRRRRYCIINFQRASRFSTAIKMYINPVRVLGERRRRQSPFTILHDDGTLSKYHPAHFSRGMQEIYIEDLFQSSALHATLTSVCETRAEFFPMMGILCIGGGVFPVNAGAAVTKLI